MEEYTKFDAADYLGTDEDIAAYLSVVWEEGDPEMVLTALNTIARAKGIGKLAEASGLNRENLYKALRPGAKPRFDTIYKVISGLNLRMQASTKPSPAAG